MKRWGAHFLVPAVLLMVLSYFYLLTIPITINASADEDLCASAGVTLLNVGLRSRASSFSRTIKYLPKNTPLQVCDYLDGWQGVLVAEGNNSCVDENDRNMPRSYAGKCISGWLPKSSVKLTSG